VAGCSISSSLPSAGPASTTAARSARWFTPCVTRSRLAEDGATASAIMALLGHASLASSQVYIDATTIERREAAAANRTYRALDRVVIEDPSGSGPSAPLPHTPSTTLETNST